jgi:hypothetical protein
MVLVTSRREEERRMMMDKKETSEDRQLSIDELTVVAGGKNCVAGKHMDEVTLTTGGSTGGGIISSIQTWIQTYFGR